MFTNNKTIDRSGWRKTTQLYYGVSRLSVGSYYITFCPKDKRRDSQTQLVMTMSLIQACRSLVLSTWLLSFCFVHFFCLDFTVAEREEWYTAFINITYIDPITSMIRTEKTECGRYGEHSLKRDAKGVVILPSLSQDWQACDPGTLFPVPVQGSAWIALIASGNCTYKEKIRHAANQNASAIVIFNVGSSNANDTITMSYSGNSIDSLDSHLIYRLTQCRFPLCN